MVWQRTNIEKYCFREVAFGIVECRLHVRQKMGMNLNNVSLLWTLPILQQTILRMPEKLRTLFLSPRNLKASEKATSSH